MRFLKATATFSTLAILALVTVGAAGAQPTAKTVTCKDGTSSKGGKGACSSHGGIAEAAAPKVAAAKTATPPAKNKAATTPPAKSKVAAAPPKATTPPAKTTAATTTPKAATGKAIAKCTDGTMSYAKTHSGACSSHGGVAEWLDGTKKP